MIGFVSRLRSRLRSHGEDRGSLPFAILVMIVGLGIGALIVPMAINQDHTTTFDNSRVVQLHASEAGFEVAIGQIRAATGIQANGSYGGVSTSLPCGPITGTVAGSGNQAYSVTLAYYTQNPIGQSAAWLSSTNNKMICRPNYGTYLPSTDTYVPSFVVMTSTGTGGNSTPGASPSRTLQSIYVVQTSNTNITGGTISIYPATGSSAGTWCMAANSQAASSIPVPGTNVVLESCETDPTDLGLPPPNQSSPGPWPWQVWAYNPDLSIELASSVSTAYPNGLCLDAPTSTSGGHGVHTSGTGLYLQQCSSSEHDSTTLNSSGAATSNRVDWTQEWSIDDNSHLQGSLYNESDRDGFCVYAAAQAAGTALTMQTGTNCSGGTTDPTQTWVPSPSVGPGAAGAAVGQVVNFQQFGRCLDVTNNTPSSTFLIGYTCKQDPNAASLDGNQLFKPDSHGYGELVTYVNNNSGPLYCLTSPLSAYTTAGTGPYVTVTACPSGKPVNTPSAPSPIVWTSYGNTDSNGNALPYSQKFTLVDAKGLCLSLTPGTTDVYNGYSKAIVQTCDGSTLQKWNAQADLQTPLVENTREIPNGGS